MFLRLFQGKLESPAGACLCIYVSGATECTLCAAERGDELSRKNAGMHALKSQVVNQEQKLWRDVLVRDIFFN